MHSGWRDGEGVGGSGSSSSPKLLDLHFILCVVLLLFYSQVVNVLSTREFWSGQILRSEEGGGVVGGRGRLVLFKSILFTEQPVSPPSGLQNNGR